MTDTTNQTEPPEQPDGIEDDSYDLPGPARAAERVAEFLRSYGDGRIMPIVLPEFEDQMPPLYARDLEALQKLAALPADAVRLAPQPKLNPAALGLVPNDYYSPEEVIKLQEERDQKILAWSRSEQQDIEATRGDDYHSADWRAGAIDSHIQLRNAIIDGNL